MNKVARHISEPSTAYESGETWRYSSSDSEETSHEACYSRYASEPCLASDVKRDLLARFAGIPWAKSGTYSPTIEGLHDELIECYEWLRPTEKEKFMRADVCHRIQQAFRRCWKDAYFFVFGSVATNLFLPTSDIDITVEFPRLTHAEMKLAAEILKNDSSFVKVTVLDRAHVPIIKCQCCVTETNIDISFNTARAQNAVEYLYYIRLLFPAMELLTLLLKQFLAARQLNHAFTGGLSSYGLVLMIIHFIFRKYRHQFYCKKISDLEPRILGDFLLSFFKYYGEEFNPMTDALAFPNPWEALLVPKINLTAYMQEEICASVFCIQDPINPGNDVGRAAHNFMQVKGSFFAAYHELTALIDGRKQVNGPMLQTIIDFPPTMIEFRKKISEMPFGIENHFGNATHIFGGQPPYGHFGPYHPSVFIPPILSNGTFLTPHRAQLYIPQLFSGSNEMNEQQHVLTSVSSPINSYFAIQQMQQNPVINMFAPIAVPINFISEHVAPSYCYPNSEELLNDTTGSEELSTSDKEMSPNEVKTSASSSSMTSCSTVTPDCDSDEQRLSLSSDSD